MNDEFDFTVERVDEILDGEIYHVIASKSGSRSKRLAIKIHNNQLKYSAYKIYQHQVHAEKEFDDLYEAAYYYNQLYKRF